MTEPRSATAAAVTVPGAASAPLARRGAVRVRFEIVSRLSWASGLVVLLGQSACGGVDHPPPLPGTVVTGSDAGYFPRPRPTTPVDVDSGPTSSCVARSWPVEGTVVELDDGTISLNPSPLRVLNTTPLRGGTISVEVEKCGGGLAVDEAGVDGSFSIQGVATGDVFIRLRPVDRPDLVTTLHWLRPNVPPGRGAYPILTRDALAELFVIGGAVQDPNPDRAHVVVRFVENYAFPETPSGGVIQEGPGPSTYDGNGQSGSLGLGMMLNVPAAEYPGERVRVVATYLDSPPEEIPTVIAPDAVTIVFLGYGIP